VPELPITLDAATGAVLLEAPDRVPRRIRDALAELLGPGQEVGCARPLRLLPPPPVRDEAVGARPCVRTAGYVHDSLTDGPGRRTSVLLAGCSLACPGCWVPHLHSPAAGALVPVDVLADALLDPEYERVGVSVLGGEPFQQPEGLLALVGALRARGCRHILAYSGYTYERLRRMAVRRPAIGAVLDEIQVLIDGPYVEALADRAGPWTGSGNQRVVDLVATRRLGRVAVLDPDESRRRPPEGGRPP
jgi:anaerobic ribonucleoside-triphosphate reductase activating protein